METAIRNVRDLDQTDRSALERVVGHQLRESQQLVIQVMDVAMESPALEAGSGGKLPEWCDVYEGLSDQEIDELDRSIVRSDSTRNLT